MCLKTNSAYAFDWRHSLMLTCTCVRRTTRNWLEEQIAKNYHDKLFRELAGRNYKSGIMCVKYFRTYSENWANSSSAPTICTSLVYSTRGNLVPTMYALCTLDFSYTTTQDCEPLSYAWANKRRCLRRSYCAINMWGISHGRVGRGKSCMWSIG